MLWENKYHRAVKLNIHEVYRDDSRQDILPNTALEYILPASMELGVEYLAFLSLMDGYFFTVSLDNSLVSKEDQKTWQETIQIIESLK